MKMKNRFYSKIFIYSLGVISIFFPFGSVPREVIAQTVTCRVVSESWYPQNNPTAPVTTGAPGRYNYSARLENVAGGPCVNQTIPFKINKNGQQGVSQSSKNTGSTGNVTATNIVGEAGATYTSCFKLGADFTCGQPLTISGSTAPGGNTGGGGGTIVNADCDGDLPLNGKCVDVLGAPTGKPPFCPSPLIYPGTGTVCTSPSGGGTTGAGAGGNTGAGATGGDCGKLIDSIKFTADGPNSSSFTSVIDMVPHLCTVQSMLKFILNTLFLLSGTVAVIFLIIGGYRYMASGGVEESANAGKKTITYAIIGLVVIVMSSAIVNIVLNLLSRG